jgi:hypothetical protein
MVVGLVLAVAVGAVIAATPGVLANDYAITWWTVDGGGGTIAGGPYLLGGTTGQPDAGQHTGGSYRLSGGFWSGSSSAGPAPGQGVIYLPVVLKQN